MLDARSGSASNRDTKLGFVSATGEVEKPPPFPGFFFFPPRGGVIRAALYVREQAVARDLPYQYVGVRYSKDASVRVLVGYTHDVAPKEGNPCVVI